MSGTGSGFGSAPLKKHKRCAQPREDYEMNICNMTKNYIKTVIVVLSLLIKTQLTVGQIFVVSESKKCFSWDNKKLRTGDTLDIKSGFIVKQNGKLIIRHPNQWYSTYDAPSKYKLDTIYLKLKTTKEYITHDSIFAILKEKNIYHCDFHYKFVCKKILGGYATSYADNIKQENNYRIETTEPQIKIEWNYPVEYKGIYYVLVTNIFEDYIDLKVTNNNFLDLNLVHYKRQGAIIYKVISEECRESDTNIVIMK